MLVDLNFVSRLFSVVLVPALALHLVAQSMKISVARVAKPFFESTNLWNAGVGGYTTYRIPGVIVTKRGTVIAYAAARRAASDWADIDIVIRRSTNGGKTW